MYMMRMKKKRLYDEKKYFYYSTDSNNKPLQYLRQFDKYGLKSNIFFTNLI